MFGNGVIMQVQMTWNAGVTNLYLNGVLVKSAPYSVPATNWSASSVFDIGAYEYQTLWWVLRTRRCDRRVHGGRPATGLNSTPPV